MRLVKFRVENYKKIRDTDWISCGDLSVFVGKNEAGKSALFRGLSKLNPSDDERYDPLKEFPRSRYTDEFASRDWRVSSARFELDEGERAQLQEHCPALKDVHAVTVTRYYSWKLEVVFHPDPSISAVTGRELGVAIDGATKAVQGLTAPEGKGASLAEIKKTLGSALAAAREKLPQPGPVPTGTLSPLVAAMSGAANEEWQVRLLEPITKKLRTLEERAAAWEQVSEARKYIETRLPRFIYFDDYGVIDNEIHLPSFVSDLQSKPTSPRIRTTHCLFKYAGLDVNKLAGLGRHQPGQEPTSSVRREIDERAILSSSASEAMTRKFQDWWEQRQHRFRYQVDGDYFRIWVSDDIDRSEIELEQRSAGMRYFFSFFTVFLVESEGGHAGNILLLDEPGLHLHGTAQARVVQFLAKLSADNQTMYSTHSPFMVDADHLERARAVFEGADGTTKVSEDVWPRDEYSLFPLQAALGYQIAQGLWQSKRQVIVEGLSDLWLLNAARDVLAVRGRETLRDDIRLVPSGGVTRLLPLASMLIGHRIEIAALLDGDEPGRREGKKLVAKLLDGEDRKCLFVGDFIPNVPDGALEDVFPATLYLRAVETSHPGAELDFTADEKAIPQIVGRVRALFARKGWPFAKARAAAALRDRIAEAPGDLPSECLEIIERISTALNALLPAGPKA